MLVKEKTQFIATDLTPRIGTAIQIDVDTLLSGAVREELRALMEQRGVIAFPEINLTDDQQIEFTNMLGTMAHEDGEGEGVYKISMDPNVNPIAEYLKGAFFWHIDGTMSDVPILASIMSARTLSQTGGDTGFANTYAAYDDLPEDEKKALDKVQVVHAFWSSQLYVTPEPSYEQMQMWQAKGTNTLPLVWKHRSGRKSLVLGSTASRVVGMGPEESTALLVRLRDWATQPQFVYQHKWKLGDMVIWDNTGTMHRAMPYPMDSGRLMHRTKLEGEEAFG